MIGIRLPNHWWASSWASRFSGTSWWSTIAPLQEHQARRAHAAEKRRQRRVDDRHFFVREAGELAGVERQNAVGDFHVGVVLAGVFAAEVGVKMDVADLLFLHHVRAVGEVEAEDRVLGLKLECARACPASVDFSRFTIAPLDTASILAGVCIVTCASNTSPMIVIGYHDAPEGA